MGPSAGAHGNKNRLTSVLLEHGTCQLMTQHNKQLREFLKEICGQQKKIINLHSSEATRFIIVRHE